MSGPAAEVVALVLLLTTLGFAVLAPRGLPELTAALPAAAVTVLLGLVPVQGALDVARSVGPTLGFLAAVLVLAELCDAEGVFAAVGALVARASRGRSQRLLALVFVAASVATAALSLDATIVLLTPVVFATAVRLRLRPGPHVYACAHLANAASLLLPVSNLTNLLAWRASGLTFTGFAVLTALPWLAVIAVEYLAFRWFFAPDLAVGGAFSGVGVPGTTGPDGIAATGSGAVGDGGGAVAAIGGGEVGGGATAGGADGRVGGGSPAPGFAVAVLVATLAGFVVAPELGLDPAWPAVLGAVVLAVRHLSRGGASRWERSGGLLRAVNVPFLLFVLALGVVVRGLQDHGAQTVLQRWLPVGSGAVDLVVVAVAAAVLANLVNNLPATLMLLPAVGGHGPGPVLAALIGVNVGPNLTYAGSLATLLWRRLLRHRSAEPELGEFLRLGVVTVPAALIAGVVALWVGVRLWGG